MPSLDSNTSMLSTASLRCQASAFVGAIFVFGLPHCNSACIATQENFANFRSDGMSSALESASAGL